MKRCFKWLINCFTRWVSQMEKEEKIGFAIGGIIGIIVTISIFGFIDKVPATTSDYEQMEKQVIAIQQDPELLFKTDCNIYINNEVITVNFENDECKLTAQYDQNFEVLSISKDDNCIFGPFALGISLFMGFMTYCIVAFVITVVIFLLEILWEFIFHKSKVHKSKILKK